MKKRLIKKLTKLGRLPVQIQKPEQWKPAFLGEDLIIPRYNHLKSIDPTNPLLNSGTIDNQGHFHYTDEFYQRNPQTKPEENDLRFTRQNSATLRYFGELSGELSKQTSLEGAF